MSFRIKPSAFDATRPMLDRIQARGWIWRGQKELDGLCCIKGWSGSEGWSRALTPWLEQASAIQETERFVLLLFEKPVACDCAELGRAMPLKRVHGALASFPIAPPGSSGSPAAAIKDQLLLFHEGERLVEPLSAFRQVDVAQWWSFDDVLSEETIALPVAPIALESMKSRSSTPFDPEAIEAGLEEVHERLGKLRGSPWRFVHKLIGGIGNNILRIFIWLLIINLIADIASKLSDGDYESVWKGVLGYGFLFGLVLLFWPSQKLIGPDGGKERRTSPRRQGSAASKPDAIYRPGMMRRMAGWLLWNSALGSGVRGKYAARLRELEELFAKDKLDEALRKAVSLGEERKKDEPKKREWFGDFPLSGPGFRENLNIRNRIISGPDYGILTDPGFYALKETYRSQAEGLLKKGDFERAAFIYAELLGDVDAAVRIFERKGDFKTAAKLAQGRRLSPSRFVPLWFKAGDKKRALRLAAQYDAFADLVKAVNESDPFHKELITAWSKRLIEIRDHARALEITERYPELTEQRRTWIVEALEKGTVDVVLIAQALKCLREWKAEQVQTLFEDVLHKTGPDYARQRIQLAQHLGDRKFERASTDKDFAAKRLPLIALPLLRRLLEDEAQYGSDKTRRDAGLSLAEASRQLALRVDIRRLNRVNVVAAPAPLKRISLNAASNLTPVRDAIGVPGNRLLIAYETGALHLTTMDGRRLWSDHIHNVRGFARIGSGNAIIVIRDEIEGSALSLLNLDDRTHKDIGFFDVRDFHREASEIGWMSFGDGRVSMLDTSSLIAAAKNGGGTLEHHWTIPITEPGRICAFLDRPDQISFLYHRQAGGLVEHWALEKSTLKVSCSFLTLTGKLRHEIQTFGWTGTMNIHAFSEDHTQMERGSGSLIAYSMQVERRLMSERQGWLRPDQTIMAPHIGQRTLLWSSLKVDANVTSVPSTSGNRAEKGVTWAGALLHSPQTVFAVDFPGAEWVDARTACNSPHVVIFDNIGRIVVADCENYQILMRNDAR